MKRAQVGRILVALFVLSVVIIAVGKAITEPWRIFTAVVAILLTPLVAYYIGPLLGGEP